MKRILLTSAVFVLLVGGATAQTPERTKTFGALEAMSPEAAKGKIAAWLKSVGKSDAANLQRLNAIWNEDRSVFDRVADSLALGDPVAAKLLNEARDPIGPAPVIVPSVFKNDKQPVFFRANLGLVYARALVNRRVYEEALETLKLFGPEQVVDPAAFLFHRAVCEHALLRKSDATKSIARLLDEASSLAPERYKTVATLMLLDMHTWKEKDLGDIARKMENIERRLEIARGGPETQRQQKEVLNRLDELIKKLENQNKKKPGDGSGQPGDQCPDGGKPGDGLRSSQWHQSPRVPRRPTSGSNPQVSAARAMSIRSNSRSWSPTGAVCPRVNAIALCKNSRKACPRATAKPSTTTSAT